MTRHLQLAFTALMTAILLSACNSDERQIKQAAQGYLDAMANYRIEEAEPYVTEETRDITLLFVEKAIMPNLAPNVIPDNTPATINITSVDITTDTTATVAYTKTTPQETSEETVGLLKRNNEWRVHYVVEIPPIFQLLNNASNGIPTTDSTATPKKIIINDSTY